MFIKKYAYKLIKLKFQISLKVHLAQELKHPHLHTHTDAVRQTHKYKEEWQTLTVCHARASVDVSSFCWCWCCFLRSVCCFCVSCWLATFSCTFKHSPTPSHSLRARPQLHSHTQVPPTPMKGASKGRGNARLCIIQAFIFSGLSSPAGGIKIEWP